MSSHVLAGALAQMRELAALLEPINDALTIAATNETTPTKSLSAAQLKRVEEFCFFFGTNRATFIKLRDDELHIFQDTFRLFLAEISHEWMAYYHPEIRPYVDFCFEIWEMILTVNL